MQPSPPPDERSKRLLAAILLFIAVAVVYSGVARCDFIGYDDPTHVTQNRTVRAGLSWHGVVEAFTETRTAVWVPLTTISLMADVSVFGLDPAAMHLVNAGWHAGAAVLLFLALHRLTGRLWPSALVAALFGVHPVNVESVAWVTERKNVLCAFFFMAALYAWTWWARERRIWAWCATFFALAAALLAKPMAVTFPCVLLLFDCWPLQRIQRERWGRLVWEKVPFFVLCAATSYMATWTARGSDFTISFTQLPLGARFTNALTSYAAYVADLVWPSNLTLFYAHPRIPHWGPALAVLVVLLALVALGMWQWRRRPYLLIGLLFFLGVMVPSLGFIQVGEQARADRFVYLAEIGIFLAVVWGLDALLPAVRPLRLIVSLVPLGALGVATMKQVQHWESDLDLFQHTIAVAPMDQAMLSLWLSSLDRPEEKQEASELLETRPAGFRYQSGHWDLAGRMRLSLGDAPKAVADFRKGLELKPDDKILHGNLATALATMGDNAGAEAEFRRAVANGPASYSIHNNYATLLERLGRKDEAREQYAQALRLVLTEDGVQVALRKIDERLKR